MTYAVVALMVRTVEDLVVDETISRGLFICRKESRSNQHTSAALM